MIRRRVRVTGHVQGVWFRDSCQQEAERLGVNGWVRNTDDLAVEGAFEGDEDAVAALIAWCHVGPPRAQISGVEVSEEEPEHTIGFRIAW